MSDFDMTNALIQVGEALTPYIEFAEGQKALLISRGWNEGPAEQYALVLLNCLARQAMKVMGFGKGA